MTTMTQKEFSFTPECFKRLFKENAEEIHEMTAGGAPMDKYSYAGSISDAVGFTSYDPGVCLEMAPRFIAVIKAILTKTTFQFIDASRENYIEYLLVCNLQNMQQFLSWGTSIRGAWFSTPVYKQVDITCFLSISELWMSEIKITDSAQVTTIFEGLVLYYEEFVEPHIAKKG